MVKNQNEAYLYLNELKEIIFIVTSDLHVEFVNKSACAFSGVDEGSILNLPAWELPMWNYSLEVQNELMFTLGHVFSTEESRRLDIQACDSKGELKELDLSIKPIIADGIVRNIMITGYNISELVQAKGFLTRRERQIGAFFENSTEGYFFQTLPEAAIIPETVDENFIQDIFEVLRTESISDKVYEFLGLSSSKDPEIKIFQELSITTEDKIILWKEMIDKGIASKKVHLINKITREKVILELKFVAMIFEDNKLDGNFCIVSNITQQYIYEKELSFLANKDPLTGLNNRRNFSRAASVLLEKVHDFYCVGMFDIDKFKNINDTYGHDVGDIAIRKAADLIESLVGEDGVVGRYGGEEFIVLVPLNAEDSMTLFDGIRKTIEHTNIHFGSGALKMTVSCGVHEFSNPTEEVFSSGVIFADNALLEAKKTGRNKVVLYKDELHGSKAVDKLTGTYNRNAFLYKNNQFHERLRKADVNYGIIIIQINALGIKQLEILNQFIKQTVGMLHGALRVHDVIGRYDDMTFCILINDVSPHIVGNIEERIKTAMVKLSAKFDDLITAEVIGKSLDDWSVKLEQIYEELHLSSD